MTNRLLFTMATAACLTGMYAVYAVIARPLVVIPELPESASSPLNLPVAHRPVENVRVAEAYLAELRWAAISQYTFHSGQAYMYTNHWHHDENSPSVEFTPFAMVWLQKDKQGREQAVSLVSDSAQLKFASPFDIANPAPGRVISAVLNGTVQIKGPDGLAVAGKQFIFDESTPSLRSTYPVQFEYASHSGEGRSLYMKLIPAEGPPGNDRPHVYGIRTVRLDGGPYLASSAAKKFMLAKLDLRMPQKEGVKLVHIQCRRDIELDIPRHTILFSEDVRARSPATQTTYDELDCDQLLMEFQPTDVGIARASEAQRDSAAAPPAEQGNDFQRFSSDLEFRRMTATGRVVKIRSPQYELTARMQSLVFDAVEHRLQMIDRTADRGVFISQQQVRLEVPNVEVMLGDDNSLPPKAVLCQGRGRLDTTGKMAFTATWDGYLRKSTDPENGLDLIVLQRKASFRQPSQKSGLGAELIRLWLSPLPMVVATENDEDKTSRPPETKPHRLVAEDDVALLSPLLHITKTNELDVRFEDAETTNESGTRPQGRLKQVAHQESAEHADPSNRPTSTATKTGAMSRTATASRATPKSGLKNSPTDRTSLGEAIDIPDTPANKSGRATESKGKPSEPLELTADRIRVRMLNMPGQTEPKPVEVETQGHVKISQRGSPGEAPMTATGDRLHLQRSGDDDEVVHLFGSPAHLRDRGLLHVEGREVHLDRKANRVWVQGKGLLQLPVPPGSSIASLGQATTDPDLDVMWQESMEFDGQTARFVGKVLAELGLSKMWCEQMDVDLASAISFSADAAPDRQPELKSIYCRENVSFQSSEYKDNKLVHVLRGRVAEFKHDHELGISDAQGPGCMQLWRRNEKSSDGTQNQEIQANRPISTVTSEWEYTRIDFKGRMTGNVVMYAKDGNLNRQTSKFNNSVTIIHGPVDRPPDTIDADNLPADCESMRCETLEVSYHAKGPNSKTDYQEMVGQGNARIEGHDFFANADEISYDGSKELFILRAWGNQNATITHYSPKDPRREASGRRIEYMRRSRHVRVDRVSGATSP